MFFNNPKAGSGVNTTRGYDAGPFERKLAAQIAALIDGDVISDGPERTNNGGWSFYWTKDGNRIQIMIDRDYRDNITLGMPKKHKEYKTTDQFWIKAEVHTRKGVFSYKLAEYDRAQALLEEFETWWELTPDNGEWTPTSRVREKQLEDQEKQKKAGAEDSRLSEIIQQIARKIGLAGQTPEVAWPHRFMFDALASWKNRSSFEDFWSLSYLEPDEQEEVMPYRQFYETLWNKIKELNVPRYNPWFDSIIGWYMDLSKELDG